MPPAPKDPKPNAAGCAERKPFRATDFFSSLLIGLLRRSRQAVCCLLCDQYNHKLIK